MFTHIIGVHYTLRKYQIMCKDGASDVTTRSHHTRLLFEAVIYIFDNSKILIQATIIDKYWLATSKKCCLNKQNFNVVFDDQDRQRWIFMGKAQQSGCKRKKCKKSRPRFNKEC